MKVLIALSCFSFCACVTGDERLGLTPTGAVTWDAFIVQRSTTTGRYHTDAGFDFDVNLSEVDRLSTRPSPRRLL